MVADDRHSWHLPPYSGPYGVGTRLHEHGVSERWEIPYCPGIRTLKFRVFYPTDDRKGLHPKWASPSQVEGFAKFAGFPRLTGVLSSVLSYFVSHVCIAALANARPKAPASNTRWPVVIFSHGLGGTDTTYSTICGNMASYGAIVVAIEHRDHSASSTYITEGDSAPVEIEYISPVDQSTPEARRRAQYMLIHRNLELRLLLRYLREHGTLDDELVNLLRMSNLDDVSLAGHSFGAATCLHFLDSLRTPKHVNVPTVAGSTSQTVRLPVCQGFKAAVLFDVWTQPLPDKIEIHDVPVLNLVSSQFSAWPANHDRLLSFITAEAPTPGEIEETAVATDERMECKVIERSLHLSQTDGGLLYPRAIRLVSGYKRSATDIMTENIERAVDFLARQGVYERVAITIAADKFSAPPTTGSAPHRIEGIQSVSADSTTGSHTTSQHSWFSFLRSSSGVVRTD